MSGTVTPLRTISDAAGNVLRSPPHNYEAERALLGAILMNNRAFEQVSEYLKPDHFAEPVNARIYEACRKLIEKGQLANPVTLKSYLEADDAMAAAGGMKYLATIAASAVTVINAGDYGRLIYDLHLRRELIVFGEAAADRAFSMRPEESAEAQIELLEEQLFVLVEDPAAGGLVEFQVAAQEAVRIAEMAHKRDGALVGVTTGLRDLDEKLAGLHDTDLIILAGRPSMGKTALATHIAFSAARYYETTAREEDKGKQVAFFSLEMSAEQLAARIIAERANIDSHRVRSGKLTQNEFERYAATAAQLVIPFHIDDAPASKVAAIRTRARRLKRKKKLGLIVIDYLQLISPDGKPENRVQEISGITRGLKALAKDLGVPVLALSQLSRAVESREDKRPQLSDLRESGTIEQDADVVMFVYREEYYLERTEPSDQSKWPDWRAKMDAVANIAEIITAKQRHGPIGTVRTRFEGTRTRFSDLEERRANDDFAARGQSNSGSTDGPPPGHPAAEQFEMPDV